jgi:hypothetical protein
MEFKPRIFIGSSQEGVEVVKLIAQYLRKFAEVQIWKNAFDFGKSNLDNLVSQIALYDYAILVATADDTVISRNTIFSSARDNVLFEFGLFSGGLGKDRVFYVTEEKVKIPSDLNGIGLPHILSARRKKFKESVLTCAKMIISQIESRENTFDLSFLPSTALAYGYFVNFVKKTTERLLEDIKEKKVFRLVGGARFTAKEIKFTILLPDDLSDDMYDKVKAKRMRDGWGKLKVDPKDIRDYDFSIDVSKAGKGLLHLVDIPFTLNALNKAIELYTKTGHFGKDKNEKLLEQREIKNFKRVIEHFASKSALTKDIVNIEIIDI